MKISAVNIQNFRGVRNLSLTDLGSLVVIAGQNGSGKSCILDAIKLLKSLYGGYQQNEYHQWFGELQISLNNDPKSFERLLNDKTQPMHLSMQVVLDEQEKTYLTTNMTALVRTSVWKRIAPELYGWTNIDAGSIAAQYRSREAEVNALTTAEVATAMAQLNHPLIAQITMSIGDVPRFVESKLLEIVFSTYAPHEIGLIDYHGPHRLFNREQLANINVDLNALKEQRKQSSIYNYNSKYSNVKSEMAGLYLREIIAKSAGSAESGSESLTQTLKDLFQTFFPDKEFLGPTPMPDGSLQFPVKVGGREVHDLDELSSGEKEILYGYLRLRSSAPKHSVILLDEPELHLNPSLTRRLPEFYHRHLSIAQNNQVWLITHSDAMLRESVGNPDYSVFHMAPSAYRADGENQAKSVTTAKDVDAAVIDLVGDLAAYKPGAKAVIFEGAEDSEFDVRMTSELFPAFAAQVNCISGENKKRVRGLYETIERISKANIITTKVFAVVDADADQPEPKGPNELRWDRYHIENYLLDADIVSVVLSELRGPGKSIKPSEAETILSETAAETLASLVVHRVQNHANTLAIGALSLRINQNSQTIASDVAAAVAQAQQRLAELQGKQLSEAELIALTAEYESSYSDDLKTGNWRKTFRGRDILKRVCGMHGEGIKYVVFRNLLLARMRDRGIEPEGMKQVLTTILQA